MRANSNDEVKGNEGCSRKSLARQQLFKERKIQLETFFDSLCKMESHYCRSSSQKLYLEPLWHTKFDLYRFYKEVYCRENNHIEPVSHTTFYEVFENKNLSLYRPKKDECDTCVFYKQKNISEEEYLTHIRFKEEAQTEKKNDK